ncbi:hypothetical protein FKW77_002380 [Venturia effusa]|uniref:geranylgeranyl diphosphate synthase n=1 Tax=Venturia effusa TaxID=50376 RepID=A0A517LGW5_9PEZI|nr:hypothetical protein FKW77_002380 [Venturia effusa]
MDNQFLLSGYTCTPPPDEIEDAFISVGIDAGAQGGKTGLLRLDQVMMKTTGDTDARLQFFVDKMLPSPECSPGLGCDMDSFDEQQDKYGQQRDETMSALSSLHDSKTIVNTDLAQKNQLLHRVEMMPTPKLQEYDTSTLQALASPLSLETCHEDEPLKKRQRIDSLLTPVSSSGEDIAFEDYLVTPFDDIENNDAPPEPFKGIHETWTEAEEKIINEPYTYLTSHTGKDIRTQILHAFNVYLKIDPDHLSTINRAIGMLHNASLLIDDIQDSSSLRRGAPSAHTVFGTASTINSANYVYFQAMAELSNLPAAVVPGALKIYCEELLNLHRGQGLDLHWRDTLTLPTETAYLKMVANKTGGLFRLANRLMRLLSDCSVDLSPLVEKLGLIFQIRDDYKNLVSDAYTSQKGHCEDLTEGKFSFLIIHAIQHSPRGDTKILDILALKTEDDALKDFVVDYMRNVTKTFAYTERVLRKLDGEARAEMKLFGERNLLLERLLDKLAA